MASFIFDTTKAKNLLEKGEIVAIPTETVYGLAAHASDMSAIKNIYDLKKRPVDKALALNIHPDWDIGFWCKNIPEYVFKLIKKFWPGPLTIICQANLKTVPANIIGPHQTIALRCPQHPMTLDLLTKLQQPIVAPSANPSNQLSPTSAQQVFDYFSTEKIYILDGGPCLLGIESTLVNAVSDIHYDILRFGAISLEGIEQCVGFSPQSIPQQEYQGALAIPIFYFKNIQEIIDYLKEHPIDNYLCIASHHKLQTYAFKNYKVLPEEPLEQKKSFYNILITAQKEHVSCVFVEYPQHSQTLQALIQKYAKPLDGK